MLIATPPDLVKLIDTFAVHESAWREKHRSDGGVAPGSQSTPAIRRSDLALADSEGTSTHPGDA